MKIIRQENDWEDWEASSHSNNIASSLGRVVDVEVVEFKAFCADESKPASRLSSCLGGPEGDIYI